MRLVVLAAGLTVFAAFALAVRYHFTSTRRDLRFAALAAASAINMVVFARDLWLRGKDTAWLAAGLALIVVAAVLFVSALQASRAGRLKLIFAEDEPEAVLRTGPYRFIRHPFYAAYIVFYAGTAVATLHPLNFALAALITAILTYAALAEERGFAASSQAAEYAAYKRTAGLFWPKLG